MAILSNLAEKRNLRKDNKAYAEIPGSRMRKFRDNALIGVSLESGKKAEIDTSLAQRMSTNMEKKRIEEANLKLTKDQIIYLREEINKLNKEIVENINKGDEKKFKEGMVKVKAAFEEMNDYMEKNQHHITNEEERKYFMHDFRNKMFAFNGRLDLMTGNSRKILRDDEGRLVISNAEMEKVYDAGRAMDSLLERLNQINKKDKHILFDAKDLFSEYKPYVYGSDAKIIVNSKSAPIVGNPQHIIRIVDNMVANAAQLGAKEIDITSGVDSGGKSRIVIRNRDTYIHPDDQKRIFEQGYTTRVGGTGTGLSEAISIARKHNAKIKVASVPAKEGRPARTTFWLTFNK